jgi:hypothetical protein
VNDKVRALIIGSAAGALLGATFAWLSADSSQEDEHGNRSTAISQLGPMDYLALTIAILGLARQFGSMLKKS